MKLRRAAVRIFNNALERKGYRITRIPGRHMRRHGTAGPPRLLNVGAGAFAKPGWHNLDMPSEWYAAAQTAAGVQIPHDLTSEEPWPIDTGSLDAIYSSHTIEHLRDGDVQRTLREARRCLRDGGYLRLQTPDIDIHLAAYFNRDDGPWPKNPKYPTPTFEKKLLRTFAATLIDPNSSSPKPTDVDVRSVFESESVEEALDHFTAMIPFETQRNSPGNHINWFNERKVMNMLGEAGFTSTWRSGYGQSQCPEMRDTVYFDFHLIPQSLYMEARR